MSKYILLMRHGKVDRKNNLPDDQQPLEGGGEDVLDVAKAAAEHFSLLSDGERIRIGAIWTGHYEHAFQTAAIFACALDQRGLATCDPVPQGFLNPPDFSKAANRQAQTLVGEKVLREVGAMPNRDNGAGGNAILVVGHGPQIGWIAQVILGKPTPTARAELLCIAVDGKRRQLLWAISPTDEKTTAEIKEKIEAKKKLAEIAGGLLIALLSFLLGIFLDSGAMEKISIPAARYALYGAAILMFVGLGLYGLTMFAYDTLLMPKRFWSDTVGEQKRGWVVRRPPSPEVRVLYQNMVHIWKWMFIPATVMVFVGVLLLAGAVAVQLSQGRNTALMLLFAAVLVGGLYGYYRLAGPVLGVED